MISATHRISYLEWAWHAGVLGLILVIPARLAGAAAFWELGRMDSGLVVSLAAAYAASVCVAGLAARYLAYPRLPTMVVAGGTGTSLIFLAVLVTHESDFSARLLLSGSALFAGGIVLPLILSQSWRAVIVSLVLATCGAATGVAAIALLDLSSPAHSQLETIHASRHTLSASYYSGYLPEESESHTIGGAIAPDPMGEGYFLARGNGEVYRFSWNPDGELALEDLGLRVPIDIGAFSADVEDTAFVSAFRVADLIVEPNEDTTVLYVSHHYWKQDEHCVVVRVSRHELPTRPGSRRKQGGAWKTIFESSPCLSITPGRGSYFAGEQIGGNMAFVEPGKILLTVGDHQFDGFYKDTNLIADPEADYGKTVLIDTESGQKSFFTFGHRNPQGLTMDSQGHLWETEHGPQGGDELNLLIEGRDYGYPEQTFGTEYGSVVWPPGEGRPPRQDTTWPTFAWVPSIGISDVIALSDPAFDRWNEDLLIASLAGHALWRVHIQEERVMYAEPIDIGERIRDVATKGTGDVVLWTDSETFVRLRPLENLDTGSALFAHHCGACHDDYDHRRGPSLRGIFDRSIASAEGYQYSRALEQVGGRWTDEKLDAFLTNPRAFVPGTKKAFRGLPEADSRARIIEYLRDAY